VIKGENSHDAHSFAAKARRGEPISIPENVTRISRIDANDLKAGNQRRRRDIFVEKY
jgi:hypothetical protein